MSRQKAYLFLVVLLPVAILAGCGGGGGGGGLCTDPVPTVSSTVPANGATAVVTNGKITATFSQDMSPTTINATTFTLQQGSAPISGTVTYADRTAIFAPTTPLGSNSGFTATITRGATNLKSTALASAYAWTFETGASTDSTAPTVSSSVPANSAVGVATNNGISATFSEAMDPATINGVTFTLQQGATTVLGVVTYASGTATFMPTSSLAPNAAFTATITTGAKDLAGNALASPYAWNFNTGAVGDTVAPLVSSTVPVNGATAVAVNNAISATFSEAMAPLSITNVTFTLQQGTTPVPGTVVYANGTATFVPTASLAGNATFTAKISTAVRDLAGNALASPYAWSFGTGAAPDNTAPTVSSTVPINGASSVAINKAISATFSEAMAPLTITNTNFTLKRGATTPVSGTVTYTGGTATFTPATSLAPNDSFTATISTGVTDLAGNAMASSYSWIFQTGAAQDTTAPNVDSTVPVSNAIAVATGSGISATFSEAMAPGTISNATFTLKQGTTPVSGTVLYVGGTATFTPAGALASHATYTATIATAVTDLAGNALASPYAWSFTTGQAPLSLGAAAPFAVLAGSTVTNTALLTTINGDLGVSPGTAVTGFPPGVVNGTMHAGDTVAAQAKLALTTAYNDAAGRSVAPATVSGDLGGMTLYPGLYKSGGSLEISSGNLILDAQGNADAVFIFQMGSTLTTSSGLGVILSGNASPANIYWQVGTSATIGTGTSFKGNILADQSITMTTGATLDGRVLTRIGAVTLDGNTITRP